MDRPLGLDALVLFSLAVFALAAAGCGPPSTPTLHATVIGSTTVAIDTRLTATRVGEAPVGDFITDTILEAARARGGDPTVALVNSGAIRGGRVAPDTVPVPITTKLGQLYGPGDLTDEDVAGWMPFKDDHVIETVSAAALKSALERGAAQLPADLLVDGGGPLLQVSGARYTIDCNGQVQIIDPGRGAVVQEGTRVTRLEVGGHVVWDQAAGIDELATTDVRLVANDFVADGFDGHLALVGGRDEQDLPYPDFSPATELIARVAALSPIAPTADGRITIIGDCSNPLTLP
jgi:hypothetical protein